MFTGQDMQQIAVKGISLPVIHSQIRNFRQGFPFVNLIRPATVGDGIFSFCDDEHSYFINYFTHHLGDLRIQKFVPASGAATRMFKHLFGFRESFSNTPAGREAFLSDTGFTSVYYLISNLPRIAFYNDLQNLLANGGLSAREMIDSWDLAHLIDIILNPDGLNYAFLPKGLILFHNYPEGARTAAEEHIVEAAEYARSNDGTARIHFTISPEHREKFLDLISKVRSKYERKFSIDLLVEFSEQLPSSDTLAVDEENNPIRNPDGSLHFRPAGHGALLTNLNRLGADIIFIKNIDNIVPDRLKNATVEYKKLLGGYLLFLRDHISRFLDCFTRPSCTEEEIGAIIKFMERHLQISLPPGFCNFTADRKKDLILNLLNRPIRVCGMVKNEGEPGGGPFWVRDKNGSESLQIVESSQIDLSDPEQSSIAAKATHFNPVDLVCSIRDHRGEVFDLQEFVDPETGFISVKYSGGQKLKAQELPGLWNGAMARWITIFIEVPVITFNPVKTVNDLLRKEHMEEEQTG